PDKITHQQLDSFIRETRKPVEQTYGKVEQKVPAAIQKSIAAKVSDYRDSILPGVGSAQAAASEYRAGTKMLRKMMLDANGNVKPGAVGIWRQAMDNDIIRRRLIEFDRVTGDRYDVLSKGMELARRNAWTSATATQAVSVVRVT